MKSEVIQSMQSRLDTLTNFVASRNWLPSVADNFVLTHQPDHLMANSGNWQSLQAGKD